VKDPVEAAAAEEYVSGAGDGADKKLMLTRVPMKRMRMRAMASVLG
jgi:hypothetical protein